jgi:hypothetical protein
MWTAQAGGEPSWGAGGKGRAGDWRMFPTSFGVRIVRITRDGVSPLRDHLRA